MSQAASALASLQRLDQSFVTTHKDAMFREGFAYVILDNDQSQKFSQDDLYRLSFFHERLSTAMLAQVAFQLLNLLDYLHQNDVVVRYLNLRNIVGTKQFDYNHTDFELKIANLPMLLLLDHACCNSRHDKNFGGADGIFIAPELHKEQHHRCEASDKADIWSLGVILYMLVTGGET